MDKWQKRGHRGRFTGERPWTSIEDTVTEQSGILVGSHDPKLEIAIMNGLTTNLHLGMIAFYRPTATRHKILMEHQTFPSDQHAVESQLRYHHYDPTTSLVTIHPRMGEHTLRTKDILAKIAEEGDNTALILFSGIHFVTGQLFDIEAIVTAAHSKGCYVGIDLAHAIGNVELHLTDWGVDFACWCNYKYMNGGPGSIGGFFLHKKHAYDFSIPRLVGWWSHKRETRFEMQNDLDLQPGAAGFQLTNPPVLETVNLLASLNIFKQTTIRQLRQKSLLLTGYLELLLKEMVCNKKSCFDKNGLKSAAVEIITPSDPAQRECQLSLKFSCSADEVYKKLLHQGTLCDTRKPNIMRVAPTPLYNTFTDVLTFVNQLKEILLLQPTDNA
ncbi:kynureninase-like [Dysidea avara]|uniref:kynureninase-like n=1 Tax=Dysidea avara TaxID=196820 RepID=UPI00332B409A